MEKRPLMLTIKHTERIWANYMRKLALEAGIPDSYRPVIMYLVRHTQASQKELAQFSHTTYAAMSRTIREMQADGYINKEADGEDKRYVRISLTQKGLECDKRLRDKLHQAETVITDALGKDKEKELEEMMETIAELIQKQL